MEKRRVDIKLIEENESNYKEWMFDVHDQIVEFEDGSIITSLQPKQCIFPYFITKSWTTPIEDDLRKKIQKLINHYHELQFKFSDDELLVPLLDDLQKLIG